MGEVELSIMKGLLEMDPRKRLTAKQALQHPYFDDIRSEDEYEEDPAEEEDENEDLLEKPIIMNNRALSPDAVVYGKNHN